MTCPSCSCRLLDSAVYCSRCGAALQPAPPPVVYAGFLRRVLAVLLDLALFGAPVFWIFDLVVPSPSPEQQQERRLMFAHKLGPAEYTRATRRFLDEASTFAVITWLVFMPYCVFCESSKKQSTYGKRLLGMRVTDLNGRRLSRGRALKRYLARVLSAIPLQVGFLMPCFTAKKQAFHDLVAGTVVVRTQRTPWFTRPERS
jgi:uncharacterized RDD family membrane protein YckC